MGDRDQDEVHSSEYNVDGDEEYHYKEQGGINTGTGGNEHTAAVFRLRLR